MAIIVDPPEKEEDRKAFSDARLNLAARRMELPAACPWMRKGFLSL
jgi:hypothetical protein